MTCVILNFPVGRQNREIKRSTSCFGALSPRLFFLRSFDKNGGLKIPKVVQSVCSGVLGPYYSVDKALSSFTEPADLWPH